MRWSLCQLVWCDVAVALQEGVASDDGWYYKRTDDMLQLWANASGCDSSLQADGYYPHYRTGVDGQQGIYCVHVAHCPNVTITSSSLVAAPPQHLVPPRIVRCTFAGDHNIFEGDVGRLIWDMFEPPLHLPPVPQPSPTPPPPGRAGSGDWIADWFKAQNREHLVFAGAGALPLLAVLCGCIVCTIRGRYNRESNPNNLLRRGDDLNVRPYNEQAAAAVAAGYQVRSDRGPHYQHRVQRPRVDSLLDAQEYIQETQAAQGTIQRLE